MKQINHYIANWHKNLLPHSWLKIGMLFSAIFLAGAALKADNYQDVQITGAPAGANDIHLVFATNNGPGGNITQILPVNPTTQTITNNGTGWDASWSGSIPPGTPYHVVVRLPNGTLITNFVSGFWTQNGNNIGAIVPGVGGATITITQVAPWVVQVGGAPAGANDIHLVFNLPAGVTIAAVFPIFPAAQGITNNGNGWDATFAALAANAVYQGQFFLPIAALPTFNSGFWTLNGANIGAIPAGNVTIIPPPPSSVPALPVWGLLSLISIVVAAGFFYLRQKKHMTVG